MYVRSVLCRFVFFFFFFKQKTAYEMRISDWSSDVCSSDRLRETVANGLQPVTAPLDDEDAMKRDVRVEIAQMVRSIGRAKAEIAAIKKIGRASCRERVCQYV